METEGERVTGREREKALVTIEYWKKKYFIMNVVKMKLQ